MKKKTIWIIFGLGVLVGGLFMNRQLGLLDIPFFNMPSNSMRVDITNSSEHEITNGSILSGQDERSFSLAAGKTKTIILKVSGETTVITSLEFKNGVKINNKGIYAEKGYSVDQIATLSKISTEY